MMIAFWGLMLFALGYMASAKVAMPEPEYLDMLRSTGKDEEFARLMGIQDVKLVRATSEKTAGPMFSKVSDLGDILLTSEQDEKARQGLNFHRWPTYQWTNNVMPYWVSRSDFTEDQRRHIEGSLATMNNNLQSLRFREWQSGDDDYVYVISGQGCWSYIGRIGGWQPLSLQENGCVWTTTIQHEFMHAAGLHHEQTRPDRDHYVTVKWDNIPQEWHSQYQKQNYRDYGIQGDYDYYSVMHYGLWAPGTGQRAFDFHHDNVDENRIGRGENDGPTQTDYFKLNNMYF